jgi:sugar transferase (PEP-CTERM/EpsH1 system associated)
MSPDRRPHVVHVLYRFDIGGLENGVVTLLNRLPESDWRHTVLALSSVNPDYCRRVERADVRYIALEKGEGHLQRDYGRLAALFRELKPDVVHTRNLAALEATVPAWWSGASVRVHGEHGRDARDPKGENRKLRLVRRAYSPFVTAYVALSRDLESYLTDAVGIAPRRVVRICNGVDTEVHRPAADGAAAPPTGWPFAPEHWVVGTVGRLDPVKGTIHLVRAFAEAVRTRPAARDIMRLAIVGDGPERGAVEAAVRAEGVGDLVWLARARSDVPQLLRQFQCFALPSLGEGISNTILEAMASGLPVVATHVGGNGELVLDGVTGELVPAGEPVAMAAALVRRFDDPHGTARMGQAARARAVREFGIPVMVDAYAQLYRALLAGQRSFEAGLMESSTWQGVRQ